MLLVTGKRWTDEEIELLEEHYQTKPNSFLLNRLNRSKRGIVGKANKIGLTKQGNEPLLWSIKNEYEIPPSNSDAPFYVGLVVGEGSFCVSENASGNPSFRLTVTLKEDTKVLENMAEYLGVGTVHTYTDDDEEYANYTVDSFKEVGGVIIPLFLREGFRDARKTEQFEKFVLEYDDYIGTNFAEDL